MREISTDINVLITPAEWQAASAALPQALQAAGYEATSIHGDVIDLTCEPDNMLVNQYEQAEGRPPMAEQLTRVVVNGSSSLSLVDATRAVVDALPEGSYWYGTSIEGPTTPGVTAACAWQHP